MGLGMRVRVGVGVGVGVRVQPLRFDDDDGSMVKLGTEKPRSPA